MHGIQNKLSSLVSMILLEPLILYTTMIVIEKAQHSESKLIELGNVVVKPFKIKKKI